MRTPIEIGKNKFHSKKEALEFYKKILASYEVGEILNSTDFDNVFCLLEVHPNKKKKIGCGILQFRIGIAKFNTKSFELVRKDGTNEFLSYTKRINKPKNDFSKFAMACRQAIQKDLINLKQNYFKENAKNGKVKCQETGDFLTYEALNIDHRQPNTFSVIVDRFLEIKNLNLSKIEYLQINGGPNELADKILKTEFRNYHKEKAILRLVKKELNLSRAYQAKIGKTKKDLTIK
ncbi:Protein of unknown function [Pustulibacterium marinum]|uniref:DUF3223 domain-containing protein n=1 Tax=Pustulibacterium marinum TaxID=1224947 RepID=A0A1I7G0K6_9FLAO|nr:DCL family protein [Pustulibacterium marinum]SFU41963.1 Protein of unknown function [Pustulibacterium marinum]